MLILELELFFSYSLCLLAEFLLSQDTLKTIKLILLPYYIFKNNQAHTITILYILAHIITILYISLRL